MIHSFFKNYRLLLLISLFLVTPFSMDAAKSVEIEDLKDKIDERSSQIDELEKEIFLYEQELNSVADEKITLQGAIKTLDISKNKLEADIKVTQNRISATNFQIEKLGIEIEDKERLVTLHKQTLADSLRRIRESEDNTFVESLLSYNELSDLWKEVDSLQRFQTVLQENLFQLKELKQELEDSLTEREQRHRELTNYDYELSNQKTVVIINRNEKNSLLKHTQNKETNYRSLIEEKSEARKKLERELLDFESQLKIAIDPDSIPSPFKGTIDWPLDDILVTQFFGDTEFARSGGYDGSGHNGVDFRASPGTPVRSVLSGIVEATGNTDALNGCYSYGKWSLVRHNNGLSSLYAHLSHISVGKGSQVVTGQILGYSGNTGYSTGPHLHLGLYATQGVQLLRLGEIKTRTNCADATIPVAPLNAYLNPIEYLPEPDS